MQSEPKPAKRKDLRRSLLFAILFFVLFSFSMISFAMPTIRIGNVRILFTDKYGNFIFTYNTAGQDLYSWFGSKGFDYLTHEPHFGDSLDFWSSKGWGEFSFPLWILIATDLSALVFFFGRHLLAARSLKAKDSTSS